MTKICAFLLIFAGLIIFACGASAQTKIKNPQFDSELAKRLGADQRGMRNYVFALLKTGPANIPAGKERDEIFKGHFANINRLAEAGKLVVAGPFDGDGGWRGIFIFSVETIEGAKNSPRPIPSSSPA